MASMEEIGNGLTAVIWSTSDKNAYRLNNLDDRDIVQAEYIYLKAFLAVVIATDIYPASNKNNMSNDAEKLVVGCHEALKRINQAYIDKGQSSLTFGFSYDIMKSRVDEYLRIANPDLINPAFFRHIGKSSVPAGFGNFVRDVATDMTGDLRDKVVGNKSNSSSSGSSSSASSGGCYIATCVYGSYDCPNVWVLRRFRDKALATNPIGRFFIKLYYATSPKLVEHLGNSDCFKKIVGYPLSMFVKWLKKKGYSDKQYFD